VAILNIFSPGWLTGGTSTQFVANPWASPGNPAQDIWVQCTSSSLQINDTPSLAGFGIIEFDFLDGEGRRRTTSFGDPGNLHNVIPENLPERMFIAQMLSVTLAMITYDTGSAGTVTLFQWG
jgi:hypothetical protein